MVLAVSDWMATPCARKVPCDLENSSKLVRADDLFITRVTNAVCGLRLAAGEQHERSMRVPRRTVACTATVPQLDTQLVIRPSQLAPGVSDRLCRFPLWSTLVVTPVVSCDFFLDVLGHLLLGLASGRAR